MSSSHAQACPETANVLPLVDALETAVEVVQAAAVLVAAALAAAALLAALVPPSLPVVLAYAAKE